MTVLVKAAVVGVLFHQSMRHTGHFAGDGDASLAFQIGIFGILSNIAFVFVAKAVFALANGIDRRQPVGIA